MKRGLKVTVSQARNFAGQFANPFLVVFETSMVCEQADSGLSCGDDESDTSIATAASPSGWVDGILRQKMEIVSQALFGISPDDRVLFFLFRFLVFCSHLMADRQPIM